MSIVLGSLQLAYELSADYTVWNGIPLPGQITIVSDAASDSVRMKIGDGATAWNALPFFAPGGAGSSDLEAVLLLGGSTGNNSMRSPDTKSTADIFDGQALLGYYDGTIIGEIYTTPTQSAVRYTGTISNGFLVIDDYKLEISHATSVKINSLQLDYSSDFGVGNESILFADSTYIRMAYGSDGNVTVHPFRLDIFHGTEVSINCPLISFMNDATFDTGKGIDSPAILNIGSTTATVINYGNASTTHNFLGTAIYELQVNSYVEDKLMTINSGGAVASAIGAGFEIEENAIITGYFKTNAARSGFSILTPAIAYFSDLSLASLTANRTHTLPNASGTFALAATTLAGYGITDVVLGTGAGQYCEGNDARLSDARIRKVSAADNVDTSTTASITETPLKTLLVPTLGANTTLKIMSQCGKVGTSTNAIFKMYYNTTPDLTGSPVQIAILNFVAGSQFAPFNRDITNKNSTILNSIFPATISTAVEILTSNARTDLNIDLSGKYIIITGKAGNIADSVRVDNARLLIEE